MFEIGAADLYLLDKAPKLHALCWGGFYKLVDIVSKLR